MNKAFLSRPEILAYVKEFVANPDNEFPRNEAGQAMGFTQRQQAALLLQLLIENVFTDCTEEQFVAAFEITYNLTNGSASRQTMEDDIFKILAKTATGKRGVDAAALASKYTPSHLKKAPTTTVEAKVS